MENLKYLKDVMGLEKVIEGLNNATNEELKRIDFLIKQKSNKDELINLAQDSITALKHSNSSLEKELFDKEKKLENAKAQLSTVTTSQQEESVSKAIATLESECEKLQDQVLENLETIEVKESEVSEAQEFILGVTQTISEIEAEVKALQKANDEKIFQLEAQIIGLINEIPTNVANLYKKAKEKHQYDAATFIIGNSCGRCKLTYAPAECAQFNNGLDLILCKGCGRLLLPSSLRNL